MKLFCQHFYFKFACLHKGYCKQGSSDSEPAVAKPLALLSSADGYSLWCLQRVRMFCHPMWFCFVFCNGYSLYSSEWALTATVSRKLSLNA